MTAAELRVQLRGIELRTLDRGAGDSVLLLHESGTDHLIWEPVVEALIGSGEMRVIAPDRRGWGESEVPDGYSRTTIEEQSEDGAALIERLAVAPAVVCGAGIGAICALDLLLRRPELVSGAVLIEPNVMAIVPAATAALSDDLAALSALSGAGRMSGVSDVYGGGSLRVLGAGAERLGALALAGAVRHPASLVAELGAPAAWAMPFTRLGDARRPSVIVSSAGGPDLLREAAVQLGSLLAGTRVVTVPGAGPPHITAAEEVAAQIKGLAASGG